MNRIEFYQMIGTGIRRYLPMGYQEYQVHIKEAEISEKKNALLVLEKEGVKNMPVMSLEPYLDRVEAGMDEDVALVDIAVDYAKIPATCSRKPSRVRAETRRCGNTADREKNGVKIINGFK